MDAELSGRRILVTGGSGGIGSAVVRALAAEGAHTAIHFHTQLEAAEQLRDEIGSSSVAVRADLREEHQVDALFSSVESALGGVDAIVVNAGIWRAEPIPMHRMTLDQWRETIDADLTSAFLTCRAFLRHLAAAPRETAAIVLIASTAALFGEADHADYSAAKAAMAYGVTRSLKNEIVRLAPLGRVNCVCPGWTDTPMAAAVPDFPAALDHATSTMALKKIATAEDIAAAVVFLLSDRLAGHISGAIFPIAGGMEGRLLADG